MQTIKTMLVTVGLATVTWCAFAKEAVPLVKPGDRIAVFGDSISTGNGYGYHAVQFLNAAHPDWALHFIGCGYSGWTAKGAAAVVGKVLEHKPDVVTIMFGTNDLGLDGARGAGEFKERMRALVKPLKQAGVRVILLTPPYCGGAEPRGAITVEWQDFCLPYMGDAVIALAQEEGLPVFDMFTAMKQLTVAGRQANKDFTLFQADNCHPNEEGQKLMGRAFADFLSGRPSPSRPPFTLTFARPQATAGQVSSALNIATEDIAWPAASTPMVLDRFDQIVAPSADCWKGPSDLSARGMAAWDAGNLYVRVEVTDPVVVVGTNAPAWGYDSVEFYLDTRPLEQRDVGAVSGYFQMMVAVTASEGPGVVAIGKASDRFDPATVRARCRRTAKGYVVSVAVPWSTLRFVPTPGANIGFGYTVINKSASPGKDYYGLWRANGNDFLNAGCLGVLNLAGTPRSAQ